MTSVSDTLSVFLPDQPPRLENIRRICDYSSRKSYRGFCERSWLGLVEWAEEAKVYKCGLFRPRASSQAQVWEYRFVGRLFSHPKDRILEPT